MIFYILIILLINSYYVVKLNGWIQHVICLILMWVMKECLCLVIVVGFNIFGPLTARRDKLC
jgi:uncharacterized membrane protein YhaH (DUF805 family)